MSGIESLPVLQASRAQPEIDYGAGADLQAYLLQTNVGKTRSLPGDRFVRWNVDESFGIGRLDDFGERNRLSL